MPVILPEIIRILKLLYLIAGYNLEQTQIIVNFVQAKLIAKQFLENIPGGSLTVKRGAENYHKSQTSKIFKQSSSVNSLYFSGNK